MPKTAAGWYTDPNDRTQYRWFDGNRWTNTTSPASPTPPPPAPTPPLVVAQPTKAEIGQHQSMSAQLAELRRQIDTATDVLEMQEIGLIFAGEHPTATSAEFGAAVKEARERRKAAAKAKSAAVATVPFTLSGSSAQGRKMTDDLVKLMLRAYNSELDALIRSTTATNATQRAQSLDKKREQIERLGKMVGIQIHREYHDLARYEIVTTGRWKAVQVHEKELEREHKARLREEKKALAEIEAEQAKLDRELTQYRDALSAMEADDDATPEQIDELRQELARVETEVADVTKRAANTRAGYVYVISNPGSMGGGVVKIGMTRRLDPNDRVRELGDASVPFKFLTHALIFSDDAVGLESELHRRFADVRVNRINMRREFFHTTPAEVRAALEQLNAHLVEWDQAPIDDEWEGSRRALSHSSAALDGVRPTS